MFFSVQSASYHRKKRSKGVKKCFSVFLYVELFFFNQFWWIYFLYDCNKILFMQYANKFCAGLQDIRNLEFFFQVWLIKGIFLYTPYEFQVAIFKQIWPGFNGFWDKQNIWCRYRSTHKKLTWFICNISIEFLKKKFWLHLHKPICCSLYCFQDMRPKGTNAQYF